MRTVLTLVAALAATPALAVDVTREATFAGDPARVWAVVGPWCAIGKWHPAVESCTEATAGGTARRTLTLKGGGTIVEDEVARDEAGRSYTYTIIDSPLPVERYTSTISVEDGRIVWSGTFAAKEGSTDQQAAEVIGGIYAAGLEGIAAALK
jgi:hypothetical protein